MTRKFFQSTGRWVLGLAVALTACAPMQATTPPTMPTSVSTQETISPTFTPAIPATSTPSPALPAQQAPMAIMANQGWQSAYYFVHPGDQLDITASGAWSHDPADPQFSNLYGPPGVDLFDARALLVSAPIGSLVGRIGDNLPFLIGEHLTLTSEQRGKLWVSMNDIPDQFSDNTGSVGVVVSLTLKTVGPGIRLTSSRDGYTLVHPDEYFVVITPKGICLTQNVRPDAVLCELPTSAALEVSDANGRTADQLANEIINENDPNFRFDRYEILVDGEPAMWISREGSDEILNMVSIVHGDRVYIWRFLFKEMHPGLGQEDQIMTELDQVQKFYDTVINSFQFLD